MVRIGIVLVLYFLIGMIVSYHAWRSQKDTDFLLNIILWPLLVVIGVFFTLDVALARLFIFIHNKTRRGRNG